MAITNHQYPNGRPVLLDQHGRPIESGGRPARPDGAPEPGGIAIPHAFTFVARHGGAWNTYWHDRFDEALRHAREDAEVMRRDGYLMALLQERQLAVSGLPWHLEVPDRRDPYQRRVRDGLAQIIRGIPQFRRIVKWLLEAIWYGRYGVQVEWAWSTFYDRPEEDEGAGAGGPEGQNPLAALMGGGPAAPPGPKKDPGGRKRKCLTVRRAMPVNGDKIGFQYDHTPYVLVNAHDSHDFGDRAEEIGTTIGGRGVALRGTWRERFLLHRHLMEDADFFNPTQAAAVHGVGIRSKLFWLNWLKLEWLGNVTDFFDRVGLGFTLWKYPAGNEQAKAEAEAAARSQSGRAHVLVPLWGAEAKEALTGVERIEVPTSGSEALVRLIEYIDRQIERYVVGQSGSARPSGGGIGNEAATEFMQSCVPVETSEILTRRGFVRPHDAVIGEEVLAYDVQAGVCRWTPLLAKSFYDDRPVSRLFTKNGRFEVFCTDDHSWAIEKHLYDRKKNPRPESEMEVGHRGKPRTVGKRSLKKANAIGRHDNVVLAAPTSDAGGMDFTTDEAAILGWLVTDGAIRKNKDGTFRAFGICQSKEENFDEIRRLVLAYDARSHETVSKAKTRTFPTGRTYATKEQHWWYVPAESSRRLLSRCGFVGKESLPGIVTRLSAESRRAMLNAMMLGDGHSGRKRTFFNSDPSVLEAFEILCALEGIACGATAARSGPPYTQPNFAKVMKRVRRLGGSSLRLEDAGRCDIWCPTTAYGTWVMRQGGRVMITGNTKAAITSDDAHLLGISLTGTEDDPGLVSVIQKYTFPDADFPVNFVFGRADPESEKKLNAGRTLVDMGVKISEAEYRAAAGYEEPAAGEKLVEPPPPPGMEGGGMPGMPGMPGAAPPGGAGGMPGAAPEPPGDFLQALQSARERADRAGPLRYGAPGAGLRGAPLLYAWVNKGLARVSAAGLPLYRWYDSERRESRVQHTPPGGGHKKAQGRPGGASSAAGPGGLRASLRKRALIARALELMFPGGWVKPAGLPALCGLPVTKRVQADIERRPDGEVAILLGAEGKQDELTLGPDGVVTMSLHSRDNLRRALPALEAAGVDVLRAGGKETDLSEREGSLPDEVAEGNAARREARLSDPEALMEAADEFLPRPEAGAEPDPEPEQERAAPPPAAGQPAPEAAPAPPADERAMRMARAAEAVRFLNDTGRPEAARAVALAYAREAQK